MMSVVETQKRVEPQCLESTNNNLPTKMKSADNVSVSFACSPDQSTQAHSLSPTTENVKFEQSCGDNCDYHLTLSDARTGKTTVDSTTTNNHLCYEDSNNLLDDVSLRAGENKLSLSTKSSGGLAGRTLGLSNRKSLRDRRPKLSLELSTKGPSMVNTCQETNLLNSSLKDNIYQALGADKNQLTTGEQKLADMQRRDSIISNKSESVNMSPLERLRTGGYDIPVLLDFQLLSLQNEENQDDDAGKDSQTSQIKAAKETQRINQKILSYLHFQTDVKQVDVKEFITDSVNNMKNSVISRPDLSSLGGSFELGGLPPKLASLQKARFQKPALSSIY